MSKPISTESSSYLDLLIKASPPFVIQPPERPVGFFSLFRYGGNREVMPLISAAIINTVMLLDGPLGLELHFYSRA